LDENINQLLQETTGQLVVVALPAGHFTQYIRPLLSTQVHQVVPSGCRAQLHESPASAGSTAKIRIMPVKISALCNM
jgi:hypothetical protein